MAKRGCHFLVLLFYAFNVEAQQPVWQRIGTSQGLPEASFTCFYRSKEGVVYAGTHDGIVVMDGNRFERITTSGDPLSQVNPFIFCITTTGKGIIYAGSRNAIWRYDPLKHKLTTLIHPYALVGGVMQLTFSSDSAFLMGATNSGLLKIDITREQLKVTDSIKAPGVQRSFQVEDRWYCYLNRNSISEIGENGLHTVLEDETIRDVRWLNGKHKWLILATSGVSLLNRDGGERLFLPVDVDWRNLQQNPYLYLDRDENVYIKFNEGLLQLDHGTFQPMFLFGNEPGNDYSLSNSSVDYFFEDHAGTSWISCNSSGLNYSDHTGKDLLFLTNNALGCHTVWSAFFDEKNSSLWLGTDHGISRGRFNGITFSGSHFLVPSELKNFAVTGIIPLTDKALLICSFGNGCWLADRQSGALQPVHEINNRLVNKNIYGAVRLGDDKYLILAQLSAWEWSPSRKSATPFLPDLTGHSFNMAACSLPSGETLFSNGTGLIGVGPGGKISFHYKNRPGDTTSISSNVVLHLEELSNHSLLVGTMGGGLCRFDPVAGKFHKIPLVSNPVNIYGIMETSPGIILLTTSNGLCLYRSGDESSSILNQENRLPFNDFNQFAFHNGEKYLFTAGEKGVLIMNKAGIPGLFHSQKQIVVKKSGKIFSEYTLFPGQNTLEIQIMLLNGLPNQSMQFRYKLDGFEKVWHELPDNQDLVTYNYLPPGEYTLSIEATDKNGVFVANPLHMPVKVKPLFYQTTLFRVIAGLTVLFLLILFVRYLSQIRLKWRLKKLEDEQRLNRERSRISRELHDNVGSQLTYLISGLESSAYLLQKQQTEKLSSDLMTMQHSARESMQQLRQAIWTLNHDKITCSALTDQFRVWLNRVLEPHQGIVCRFETQLGSDPVLDPLKSLNIFRMMQESVNNVIKHAGPCNLLISLTTQLKDVKVVISDTGKGFTPGEDEGTGMGSLRKRAEEAGIILRVHSQGGEGTTITIGFGLK
ncbi:MAG: histidine kinase [Bacteroidales bacterium]